MSTDRLADTWHTRDFPILLELGRAGEANDEAKLHEIGDRLEVSLSTVINTVDALKHAGYIARGHLSHDDGGMVMNSIALSERGRRAIGLWPDPDVDADALIQLLEQAADHVTDEDDAGAFRKAGRLLRDVPSAVVADVTAALIRQQTGI
jgi:DNA-binding MarR family transcriptional regulator